jgi:hypothetical protein
MRSICLCSLGYGCSCVSGLRLMTVGVQEDDCTHTLDSASGGCESSLHRCRATSSVTVGWGGGTFPLSQRNLLVACLSFGKAWGLSPEKFPRAWQLYWQRKLRPFRRSVWSRISLLTSCTKFPAAVQPTQGDWQQDGFTTRIAAVACRYPQPAGSAGGCSSGPGGAAGFWEALQGGTNLQSVVPASRWDIDAVYMPDTAAKYAVTLLVPGILYLSSWIYHLCAQ